MQSIKLALTIIIGSALTCLTATPAYAVTGILIESSGEYLGQAQTFEINDSIDAFVNADNSVSVVAAFENWTFTFDNAGAGQLLDGFYEEASRYPFQSSVRPGLDVSGDGRGCNALTGHFVVLQAEYGPGPSVTSFAADLTLFCDGSPRPFQASVRFNSVLAVTLDIPIASAGRDQIVFERNTVSLDASLSSGGGSEIVSYRWEQVDGPTVNLSSASSVDPSFDAPDVSGAPVMLAFRAEVTNEDNVTGTDIVTIEVRDRSAPRSVLKYRSEPGDPVGQGQTGIFTEDDGAFVGESFGGGSRVNMNFEGDDLWQFQFAADDGRVLGPGAEFILIPGVPRPDLVVAADNRSCPNRDGFFAVRSFSQFSGTVTSLSVEFEQVCTTVTDSALTGELFYRVVLPEANAGLSSTALERTDIMLDPSASMDAAGSLVTYQWQQQSGPPVALNVAPDGSAMFNYELGDGILQEVFEFELTVTDESGQTDTDKVTITVDQDNQGPNAADDTVVVQQGFTINFDPLSNDTDVDGQIEASTLQVVDAPAEGFIISTLGGFSYLPPQGFFGTTSATYVVLDNDGAESNTGTITLEVTPGPLAFTDSVTTETGTTVTIDILSNDMAAGSPFDPATVTIVRAPSNGTVTVNADGTLTYTAGSVTGPDIIRYEVTDGNGLTTPPASVVVDVEFPAGQAPPPPATPPAPPPASTPPPTQQTPQTQAQNTASCNNVGAFSGKKSCGNGSLSWFNLLGLTVLLLRRRRWNA